MQGMNPRTVGVIIGRFQTPELTDAHKYLFSQVATRVPRVLILLGCSPYVGMKRNPMEYSLRARMVEDYWLEAHPNIPLAVQMLNDRPSDTDWARRADDVIGAFTCGAPAIVYCGPDGAGPTYEKAGGRHGVEVLDAMGGHATKVREAILPVHTSDFRKGVCYAVDKKFVAPFQTIDAIVYTNGELGGGQRVALIRKHEDGECWRLPGGHVDGQDSTLEATVRREVQEELHVEVGPPKYICSARIADWRYRGGPEGIMTAAYAAEYVFGGLRAGDDADEAKWMTLREAMNVIHPIHENLLLAFMGAMQWKA